VCVVEDHELGAVFLEMVGDEDRLAADGVGAEGEERFDALGGGDLDPGDGDGGGVAAVAVGAASEIPPLSMLEAAELTEEYGSVSWYCFQIRRNPVWQR